MKDGDTPPRGDVSEAHKSLGRRHATGFAGRYLSGARVLDIGYRGYVEGAAPVVPHAVGVDLDYPGYDGRTLPFADASQDSVFSSHCLEHVDDSRNAIRQWFRVLKPGGFLIIVVPHQFLYEKRAHLPSRWNGDHRRFYTPASLLAEVEAALPPNAYRVRHLADNDDGYDYTIGPDRHAAGCYEIELVIQKIEPPSWTLQDQALLVRSLLRLFIAARRRAAATLPTAVKARLRRR